MTCRADEVQARVDAQVGLLVPLRLLLLAHVRFVLVVNEVDNGVPAVPVVHIVAKARRVDDGELDLEGLLLELGLDDLDLSELVEQLGVPLVVRLGRGELGREERVDERGLSQAGLADDHDGEVRAALGYDFVPLCARMGEQDAKDENACARTWLGRLAIPMPSPVGTGAADILAERRTEEGKK